MALTTDCDEKDSCFLLLSAAFVLDLNATASNNKVRSGGQECPPYGEQQQSQERRTGVSALRRATTKSRAADRSVRPTPEPGIILRLRRQAPAYRVLADVLQLLLQASIAAQGMVERLLLPDRTRHSQYLIHAASRDAFN